MKPYVYWSRTEETINNFGDSFNVPLFEKMGLVNIQHAGGPFSLRSPTRSILVGMGSILESAKFFERLSGRGVFIWGAGSKGALKNARHLRKAKFFSVRGPLTKDLLQGMGIRGIPDVFGDPALLAPHFWGDCSSNSNGHILVIPHYKEFEAADQYLSCIDGRNSEYRILDVRSPIDEFIEAIASAKGVLSSSLHGLILADAYGVPNAWLSFSDRLGGGRFKFDDHHLAFWGRQRGVFRITRVEDIDSAANCMEMPPMFDPAPILNSFPDELRW